MATKKPAQSTEVANVNPFAVASTEVPDYIKRDAGRGSEEVGADDMVLPRLEIVQSESPIKEENPGCEGHLFNSVSQEIYGETIYFIPVYFRLEWLVWRDKDFGGGFFGSFGTQQEAEARLAEVVAEGEIPEAQLEIVDTPVQYGLRIDPETLRTEQLVISMAKSKAKISRKWNSQIQMVGGDRFSRVYRISTFRDENSKGKKFWNYVVANAGFPPKPAYEAAEKLYEVFRSGQARAAHDTVIDAGEGSASADRGDI